MADISVTAASVIAGSNSQKERGTAGATITAGQVVYKDSTTEKYLLADANSATAAARGSTGLYLALNGASDGQPMEVHKLGDVTLNAVLTAGVTYYLSDTPGGIAPLADVASGEYYCPLGVAKSTTVLAFAPNYSGVSA